MSEELNQCCCCRRKDRIRKYWDLHNTNMIIWGLPLTAWGASVACHWFSYSIEWWKCLVILWVLIGIRNAVR